MSAFRFLKFGCALLLLGMAGGCETTDSKNTVAGKTVEYSPETKVLFHDLDYDISLLKDFSFDQVVRKERNNGMVIHYTTPFMNGDGFIDIQKMTGWYLFTTMETEYAFQHDRFIATLKNLNYSAPFDGVTKVSYAHGNGGGHYAYAMFGGKRCFTSRTGYNLKYYNWPGEVRFDTLIQVRYCGSKPADDLIKWLERVRLK